MSSKRLKELYEHRQNTYINYNPISPSEFGRKIRSINEKIKQEPKGKRLLELLNKISSLRSELHHSKTLSSAEKNLIITKIINHVNEIEYILRLPKDSLLDMDEYLKKNLEKITKGVSESISLLTKPQSVKNIHKSMRRRGYGLKHQQTRNKRKLLKRKHKKY